MVVQIQKLTGFRLVDFEEERRSQKAGYHPRTVWIFYVEEETENRQNIRGKFM